MKTPSFLSMIVYFASLASFLGTAGAARQDAARAAITAQTQALSAAIEKGDAAAVASLFSSDARLSVSMAGGVVSGRERITNFWRAALGGGLRSLVLTPADLVGDGNLRVESGTYQAFGADRRELGRGQYLMAWVKEAGVWKISRDFAHGDAAPPALPSATGGPDPGVPPEYTTRFRALGGTLHDEQHGLTTVYANELAAAVTRTEAAHYPDGSVILMEFAEPRRDGEEQLLRDANGQPLKGPITHIDVMRRGGHRNGPNDKSRAGEWEFASYRADGTTLISASSAEQCAACHLKAGAEKDFVFRLRPWF